MAYTPFHKMVHLWMNGEYKGVYQLCDQVDVRPGRIDIDEMDEDEVAGDSLTGGYFIEIDAYASQEDWWFRSNRGIPVTIKSPEKSEDAAQAAKQVQTQQKYIVDYFNKMEALVYARNYDDEDGY